MWNSLESTVVVEAAELGAGEQRRAGTAGGHGAWRRAGRMDGLPTSPLPLSAMTTLCSGQNQPLADSSGMRTRFCGSKGPPADCRVRPAPR